MAIGLTRREILIGGVQTLVTVTGAFGAGKIITGIQTEMEAARDSLKIVMEENARANRKINELGELARNMLELTPDIIYTRKEDGFSDGYPSGSVIGIGVFGEQVDYLDQNLIEGAVRIMGTTAFESIMIDKDIARNELKRIMEFNFEYPPDLGPDETLKPTVQQA